MSEEFKKLLGYMGYIANNEEYEGWTDDYVGKKFREKINNAKEEFAKENIDFSNLSNEEYKLLRFADWDENTKNLIPLWLFRILPNDTKLKSFSGKVQSKKNADDDIRFGVTAYTFCEIKSD